LIAAYHAPKSIALHGVVPGDFQTAISSSYLLKSEQYRRAVKNCGQRRRTITYRAQPFTWCAPEFYTRCAAGGIERRDCFTYDPVACQLHDKQAGARFIKRCDDCVCGDITV